MDRRWDVIVIGGGPAGLSAALMLGRCRRSVLVFDAGTPRSWASEAMHGFPTREGVSPQQFRELARAELRPYPVTLLDERVAGAERREGYFSVETEGGRRFTARKLLLATGLFDELPPLEGIERFFGKSVFQCPFCDGWEMRERALAVYGEGRRGVEMARAMTAWSRNLVLFTHGAVLGSRDARALARNGVAVRHEPIARLDGDGGRLRALVLDTGEAVPRDALFFDAPSFQQSPLGARLGCRFDRNGGMHCRRYQATDVPGMFVAGNAIKDVHMAIVAAAEGTKAAMGIHKALTREDFERADTGDTPVIHPDETGALRPT